MYDEFHGFTDMFVNNHQVIISVATSFSIVESFGFYRKMISFQHFVYCIWRLST